jgi:lipopolysaccharide/colanic/teichoic acid biosynthesis glycosyltransferase
VLQARPGLTGPAQLTIRERANVPPPGVDVESYYLTVLVPRRTRLDLEYLRRPTLAATLRYVVLTGLFVVGLADLQE